MSDDDRPRCPFDHHTREFARDPWKEYRELRRARPLAYSDRYDGGFWILSKYEDVRAASMNPKAFSSDEPDLLIPRTDAGWLLPVQSDPPLTAQYRKALHHVFSLPAVRALEPSLREWATEAIDAVIEQGQCDIARDLARPLPGKVTMALMGWPVEEWQDVLDPLKQYTGHAQDDPERQEGAVGVATIRRRVTDNLALRRRQPGDDLVSDLVAARVDGRPLTDEEIVALAMMVIFGGIDTTVAAIGNMLFYVDLDRKLRTRLIEDASLIPTAVDELLRYEPPVQGFARFLREDISVRGHTLRKDEKALILWASANRDEEVFPDPDTVRLDRSPNPHLTFGIGVHRCLGAHIARAELRVVLEEVLRRMPDYEIDHSGVEPTASAGTVFERVKLPTRFTPGKRSTR
jgi:cytochrome P450